MLALTRRQGEGITIFVGGVEIKLQFARKGNATRVFINAPKEAKILRDELLKQKGVQECERS